MEVNIPYKSCFVPLCESTTKKTPHKLFISVPKDPERRKHWFRAARRADYVTTGTLSCCEDHFNVSLKYLLIL